MITKVTKYMKQHHMVQKGDTLIVGVSGGADSVCLLSVLKELRETLQLNIICAHVNHMYRETAIRDEIYVQELCDKFQIPCYIERIDVATYAKENKLSFEEAGRLIRYDFFARLKEECNADKVAVAHNRGDCAETMLFHLFRGSHLKGLGGISPVNGDIIRPLLDMERSEIEAYLQANKIKWQQDETNDSTEYSRNYIRHEILPSAEKMYPGVQGRIADTAFELQQIEDYLKQQTQEAWQGCCEARDGGTFIIKNSLLQNHPVIVSKIIYQVLVHESGGAKDLTKVHVKDVMKLMGLQPGRQISLPGNVYAYRTTDGILIRRDCYNASEERLVTRCVRESEARHANIMQCNGVESIIAVLSSKELEDKEEICFGLEGLGNVKAKVFSDFDMKNIPQKTYTKWFDYDKITKYAVFRKRLEGDYLVIDDKGNHKKLKEYFIQEKIPAYKRNEVWVLADDNHIMWVPGYRISSFYKVSEKTKRILELNIGGKEDE